MKSKYEGWRLKDRYKWESGNKILVVAVGKVLFDEEQAIVALIRKLLAQFGLPFEVEAIKHGSYLSRIIHEILQSCLSENLLNDDCVIDKLNERREKESIFCPAIVLKINPTEYRFVDPQAIYGIGMEDGLVMLRCAHEEAVRHELGHMLGINSHCTKRDCVMNYLCLSNHFCDNCEAKLRRIWHRVSS